MVGALVAGPVAYMGRWRCIMVTNVVTILGSLIQLNYTSLAAVCVGRSIFGIGVGAYTVLCPKYVMECSPKEISGPIGGLIQVFVCLGIIVPPAVAIFFDKEDEDSQRALLYTLIVLPGFFAALQAALMLVLFRHDTPNMIKERGTEQELRAMMERIYAEGDV